MHRHWKHFRETLQLCLSSSAALTHVRMQLLLVQLLNYMAFFSGFASLWGQDHRYLYMKMLVLCCIFRVYIYQTNCEFTSACGLKVKGLDLEILYDGPVFVQMGNIV